MYIIVLHVGVQSCSLIGFVKACCRIEYSHTIVIVYICCIFLISYCCNSKPLNLKFWFVIKQFESGSLLCNCKISKWV